MEEDNKYIGPIRGTEGADGKNDRQHPKSDKPSHDKKTGHFSEQKKGVKPIPPKLRKK